MLLRSIPYGALLRPSPRKRTDARHASIGKVARELAGGDRIDAQGRLKPDAWPPASVIDGWPPKSDSWGGWPPGSAADDWSPRDAAWPGGGGWAMEASPFPPDVETDTFAWDIDPRSPKGQWYAALDRNFPGWEEWDGAVTVELDRH